ncbi:somatostatin receptor type 5-like [Asterias rubens]|uniref:somatostatin receptor type 5-like n=1 Tax=Asterias rubens TaxID=7604 RepID=UPI0014557C20|nr:somatostatin receptor type 5-like [Asterias rubens]
MDKSTSIMLTTAGYSDILTPMFCANCTTPAGHPPDNSFLMSLQQISFIVTCILGTVGLLCNGFIILILMRFPNMKTLANYFILNLALADFLFMISFLFLGHQLRVNHWVFGKFMCRLIVPYDAMTQFLVIYFVMIMSIDRYFAICLPIKSMNFRTLRNGKIVCAMIWGVAILTTLPLWIYTEHTCVNGWCTCLARVSSNDEDDPRWWIIYTIIIGFCVPLTIVCICYLLILQNLLTSNMQDSKNTLRRAARRVAILVICIIIVFILCFLPFYVFQLVYSTIDAEEDASNALILIYIITWTLMYSHSIINPIVYALVGENFRKNITFMFCKRSSRHVMYTRQSSMRTSSFRRTRNSLKSCNSNDPNGMRPHNGYYVHLDTGQHRGAREDPV